MQAPLTDDRPLQRPRCWPDPLRLSRNDSQIHRNLPTKTHKIIVVNKDIRTRPPSSKEKKRKDVLDSVLDKLKQSTDEGEIKNGIDVVEVLVLESFSYLNR
ncbi:hypothetical protein RB195_000071 [Necator americanus]|uniref:Uncharacterized protein n=1 Tax=Necator americanus TaxID=51031 RepID=A0ABR1D7T1_NECAM